MPQSVITDAKKLADKISEEKKVWFYNIQRCKNYTSKSVLTAHCLAPFIICFDEPT